MNIKLALSLSVILSVKLSMLRAEVVDRELESLLKQQVTINEGVQIRQVMPVELDDSITGVEKAVLDNPGADLLAQSVEYFSQPTRASEAFGNNSGYRYGNRIRIRKTGWHVAGQNQNQCSERSFVLPKPG